MADDRATYCFASSKFGLIQITRSVFDRNEFVTAGNLSIAMDRAKLKQLFY